ncbi:tRNA (guanine-N(7)-)-methyltransferase non-catalytic subunit WDR4-like [Acanthaster planci]|uniref:tRNA (guanine-N(7)-)-methyltransferase non-catalytic subunit n=1 Tax=Acanthaster planci TaxID=133434 RepID=A0A8B7ZL61_ACAPL|nr:tRNA (guanine-N(7)-)-methyltransferase non-catalytic subunit WDR4-like [Acanthaster planci]
MASLLWSKGTLLCVCGPSFQILCQSAESSGHVVYRETHRRPGQLSLSPMTQETGLSRQQSKPVEEPTEEITSQEGDPSHSATGTILAFCFSPSGRYLALCDDHKILSLYDTQDWHLLSNRVTLKRCMAVAFNNAENILYVADKFGDVHSFSVTEPQSDGSLILGHLSMLLDMVVSPDDRYILTSDRDEKIRVSCLPNAYNIHAFCLGHTEFVSKIAILPGLENTLVTGGGDATLRFWDYRQGKQLSCVHLQPVNETSSEEQQLIVTGITCCRRHRLVAVTILGSHCIWLFRVTSSEGDSLLVERLPSLDVQAVCWSACFDGQDHLWILRQLESQPVEVYSVVESHEGFSLLAVDESEENSSLTSIVKDLNMDWSFFQGAVNTPSLYTNLYKKSFDNTQAYLKRKQQRIKDQQEKKSMRKNKTQWSPVGKRARLKQDKESSR